ncbi:Zinc finger bed domain-containing protein 1 [Plakobranchus ocellatus]|uniref:Zinc finger bed domain-containing protein 1 n=1 Tax=Plakobranchus ocellatus TaxID=259542 RepID=A0AAV4CIC3_9GAST|nr:Zinc finger bed domain-containing protein 1 [Plakobranchus ocellatus]
MSNQEKTGPRRPRSVVWYYFDKPPNEPFSARCKLCGLVCHHALNTSNLFKHLRVKHPASYREANETRVQEMQLYLELKTKAGKPITNHIRRGLAKKYEEDETSSTSSAVVKSESPEKAKKSYTPATYTSRKSYGGVGGSSKPRQNLNRAFIRMLAKDMLHPSLFSGAGFKEFLSACDVRAEMPSKKTICKSLLPELVEETKLIIKLDLKSVSSLALSIESWPYKETQSFVTISAHFIKDNWSVSSFVLESFDCTDERTETKMATNLKRITDEWSVTERVVALVSAVPDEIVSSASLVNGWEEIACFGRILNRIVIDALASVSEIERIQKKANEAVTFFDVSVKASTTLSAVQEQHSLPDHRLKQERLHDWSSIYYMFVRVIEQYEAINTVLCFLNRDLMCICDDEVELIRGVVQVLKPFQAATQELCTEPYTCLSKVIPIATLLQQVISAGMGSNTPTSSLGPQNVLKNALISQMQQRFSGLENSSILCAATLLDPRFKQHAFTDPAALDAAKQRLIMECTQVVVQNSEYGSSSKPTTASSTDNTASFWGIFDKKVNDADAMKTDATEADNETRRFFKEVNIPRTADPFNWWKLNEIQFPHLKILAKKFLCVPATAITSNRLFTKGGVEFARRRDLFKPGQLNGIIFLNQNMN